MSLYLITAPTEDVVSLEEAKAQLRETGTDHDDMITALIAAAVSQIDPPHAEWFGRALRPQTWELRGNCFPWYSIELPYPPLISVDSVKYDDGDGVEQTLIEGTGFRVIGLGGRNKASIAPIYQGGWPSSVRCDSESVRIRFTCGYPIDSGDSPSTDTLPQPIKQAVLLMVKHLWGLGERNLFVSAETVDGIGSRQFIVSENAARVMSAAAEILLSRLRVWD